MPSGKPFRPDYVTQQFSRFLNRHADQIKKVRFHDLRHTSASLLLAEGFSLEEIQAWLGHESIKSTEVYAHLQVIDKTETAESMGKILQISGSKVSG